MKRIVIALGGNALGNNYREQQDLVRETANPIVDLIEKGYEIVLSHGNGPQVGMINLAFDQAESGMPFPECGAMSQGYIGYHLQNAIQNELAKRGIHKSVASLITQVLVDSEDPAFQKPTKPIGSFYSQEEANRLTEANPEDTYIEDSGRGYRRVVPSPLPQDIIEKDMISDLVAKGHLVIASGGGGIPVVKKDNRLEGVAAVIDKDFASALLAELVGADSLIILTAVDRVALNFGKADQVDLEKITAIQAQKYADQGMFATGSMLPKVKAALRFVESGSGKTALICSLDKAAQAIAGETGTLITAD